MKKLLKFSLIGLAASAFLIGCGSSSTNDPINENIEEDQTSISGKAVDGYLRSATVVLDLDGDGFLSPGEPVTATDVNGSFTLDITDTQRANPNFDTAMLLVYDGIDNDTGNRYTGKLKAPNDGSSKINVTPITTQVAAVVQKSIKDGNITSKEDIQSEIQKSKEKVKIALNIPDSIDVGADPVELAKTEASVDTKAFLGANIALQKAIDTMVSAAKLDPTHANKDEKEISEIIYEALAIGLENMDLNNTSTLGVTTLIEKAATDDEAKSLLGENVTNSYEIAVKIADDTEKLFESDEIDFSDETNFQEELIQATIAAEYLRDQYIEQFESVGFDFNISEDDLTFDINTSIDYEKERLENIFSDYNVSDEQLELIKDLDVGTLSTEEILEKLKEDENLSELATLVEEQEKLDESELETTIDASQIDEIAFGIDEKIYDTWLDEDNGIKYYTYNEINIGDKELTFKEYKYDGSTWLENSNEERDLLIYKDGDWISTSGNEYTRENDNKQLIFSEGTVITKNYIKELSGDVFIPTINSYVNMPVGSLEYGIKIENTKDKYELYDKARDWSISEGEVYLENYPSLISAQCGDKWFTGNNDGGYAFAAETIITDESNRTTYTCDTEATSGKLFEVQNTDNGSEIINEDAGSWEIKNLDDTHSVLVVKPNDIEKYSDEDRKEYPIFAQLKDENGNDIVYNGNLVEKGTINTFQSYNKIAIDAIKTAVENKEFSTDSIESISVEENNTTVDYVSLGTGTKIIPDQTIATQEEIYNDKTYYAVYTQIENGLTIKVIESIEIIKDDNIIKWSTAQRSDGTLGDRGKDYYEITAEGLSGQSYEENLNLIPEDERESFTLKTLAIYDNGIDVEYRSEDEVHKSFLFNDGDEAYQYYLSL